MVVPDKMRVLKSKFQLDLLTQTLVNSGQIFRIFPFFLLATLAILASCKTNDDFQEGIQPKYSALNPSRILAITPIVLSLPGDKSSVIDPVIIETIPMIQLLEHKVLEAFKDQPAVNGISFKAVRTALDSSQSKAFETLIASLDDTLNLLKTPQRDLERKVSMACINRKKMSEFYLFCLRPESNWTKGLNELSSAVFNADAALLIFLTELRRPTSTKGSFGNIGLEVLLVDTNNGEPIWTRRTTATAAFPLTTDPKVNWALLIDQAISEQFWQGFPGRVERAPAAVQPAEVKND